MEIKKFEQYNESVKNEKKFWYRTDDRDEILEILSILKEEGYLGEEINYGTYLPDSITMETLFNNEDLIYDCDVAGIVFHQYDINNINNNFDYHNKNYPHLFGKDNTLVGLITNDDVDSGDVFDKRYKTVKSFLKAINN